MERNELLKKVQEYFEDIQRTNQLEKHEPDEINNWDIYSGIKDGYFHREKITTVHGKFKYAVACAVQQPEFWGFEYPTGKTIRRDGLVKKCNILSLQEDDNIPNVLLRDFNPIVESD